jgi:PHD/YefM family antitoxin component YafN of YafNO toxin-antitoxin module
MANITNSHSLTGFLRNARGFIDGLNRDKEPLLITVNGKVRAVMVDPVTYQQMEDLAEKERFIAAVQKGLEDIAEGRTKSIEDVHAEVKSKYAL